MEVAPPSVSVASVGGGSPVLAVFGQPLRFAGGLPGPRVAGRRGGRLQKGFAVTAASAAGLHWTGRAGRAEGGPSGRADRADQPVGAGRGAAGVVNDEVIDGEPFGDDPPVLRWLDPIDMTVFGSDSGSAS